MNSFYVPYSGGEVAAVDINGHAFLFLSREREVLEDNLELLGADTVEEVSDVQASEEEFFLSSLAAKVDGGVVIAGGESPVEDIIASLRAEVPWVQ